MEGRPRPGAVFLMIERDKGNGNYKDRGLGRLWLSTIDFERKIMTGSDD